MQLNGNDVVWLQVKGGVADWALHVFNFLFGFHLIYTDWCKLVPAKGPGRAPAKLRVALRH